MYPQVYKFSLCLIQENELNFIFSAFVFYVFLNTTLPPSNMSV